MLKQNSQHLNVLNTQPRLKNYTNKLKFTKSSGCLLQNAPDAPPCMHFTQLFILTLYMPTLKNGQTHSNISSSTADKLFECLTILWGWRLKALNF